MNKEEYIKTLTDQIRCKMARPEVARELEDHIEDQTRAFMSEGMSRQEAESAAVKDMEIPVDTGVEMDKIHRPKMPWGMIALIIVLSVTGCIFQYILNNRKIEAGGDGFLSQGPWMVHCAWDSGDDRGLFCRLYKNRGTARELMIGLIVLIVLGKQFLGLSLNGNRQWIGLPGGWSVNIPLILMLTVPLYAAILYGYRGKGTAVIVKKCIVDDPGCFLAWQSVSLWMTCVLLLTYLVVLALAVYRGWYRLEKKAGARWDRGFCRGASVSGAACCCWFFGADYQRNGSSFISLRPVGWDKQPQEIVSNGIMYVRAILGNSSLIGQGNGRPGYFGHAGTV